MELGKWLDTWIALYVEPSGLAASTKAMYCRAVEAVPLELAQHDLRTLSALDLLPWLLSVAAKHPRAAQLDRQMLSRSLGLAAKLQLCSAGIVDPDTLPMPRHQPKRAVVLQAVEAAAYVAEARRGGYRCGLLLILCLVCGLRRGEALGLQRRDIDAAGVLQVVRQRQRIRGHYGAVPLKSASARRALQLPADVLAWVSSAPRCLGGWVVDATPEQMQADHVAILTAAGLPRCTIHGLRHTMATMAAGAGVSIKLLQVALGHAHYGLTADLYAGHAYPPSGAPALVWQGVRAV